MEKVKYKEKDCVNPDTVCVSDWGIEAHCEENDAVPVIYTKRLLKDGYGPILTTNNKGMYHAELNIIIGNYLEKKGISYISSRSKDIYIRIWLNRNIISCWKPWDTNDINGCKEIIKDVVKLLKSGNFNTFNTNGISIEELPKEQNTLQNDIDFSKLMFYWADEIDDEYGYPEKFIFRAPVSELFRTTSTEKTNYYKEGEKAWVAKHGDIDPAYYHLLMYQENKEKKNMKIELNENDIKNMVTECIKKLIKEDVFGYSGEDLKNMGLENPGEKYQPNILELKEKCAEFNQAIINFRNYLRGVEDELEDENQEKSKGFILNLQMKHMWSNPNINWKYEDEEWLIKTLNRIDDDLSTIQSDFKDIETYN